MRTARTRRLAGTAIAVAFGALLAAEGAFVAFRLSAFLRPVRAADLPSAPFASVRFFDRRGELLQEVLSVDSSRAVRVPLAAVSPYLVDALIAVEDRRFLLHGGVDPLAVLRAAWQNLRARRVVSGGSTITCQLARMLRPAPRTVVSKLREWHLAWRMEAGMSKREILEEYVNRLPMGGNLYGAEAGARAYFGQGAGDLSLAQAACLAAIPNAPTRLSPFRDAAALARRQATILDAMADGGFVTRERAARARIEEVRTVAQAASFAAPHFVYRACSSLPTGTREVTTTLDATIQRRVARLVGETVSSLRRLNVSNAAAVLLDNRTGEILAYVGSADFFATEDGGMNDGAQAARQPGSALKPFLYTLAFSRGYTGASVLPDIPAFYKIPDGIYSPRNYSRVSYGPVRLRAALANSLNVPAVRLADAVGTGSLLAFLRSFGFASLDKDSGYYGLGLALGDGEVTLTELAGGYLALARGGAFAPPRGILAVDGEPVAAPRPSRVADPAAVFLTTDILSDRYARSAEFGVDSVLALPFPCAVKTGTSYRYYDNWAAGFTRNYTLAVWVGNFDRRPMQKVSGVTGAAPLFARIMNDLYRGEDFPEEFDRPDGLARVAVCALSGKSPTDACPAVVREYLLFTDLAAHRAAACDVHVRVAVDARDGLAATRQTPSEHLVVRTFVSLPRIYDEWYRRAGIERPPSAESAEGDGGEEIRDDGAPEIRQPADGAVYARLPDLDPAFCSIRFRAEREGTAAVGWYLDGEFLRETRGEHELLWPAAPGIHTLVARCGGGEDSIRFTVR